MPEEKQYNSEIAEAHVEAKCKPGQGNITCRYLGIGPCGWTCLKTRLGLKDMLDWRVANNTINAQGDNCNGWEVAVQMEIPPHVTRDYGHEPLSERTDDDITGR